MVFTEFPQQKLLAFKYESFDLAQLASRDTSVSGESYRRKPEFAFSLTTAHMDMSRLRAFIDYFNEKMAKPFR
jgi:hypothetical protein